MDVDPVEGTRVRVDLGCGNAKKPGFIGLDFVPGDQVDHVIDLTADRYPFEDRSVDEVFSAHFLEHIDAPNHVFSEIGRICKPGARIEIYTPYAFSAEAFLYGHLHQLTEEPWLHFCVSHRDVFAETLGGRWLLHNINYVVPPAPAGDLAAYGIPMDFAIKFLKDVVYEFGVQIEFQPDLAAPVVMPTRTWSTARDGERHPLEPAYGAPIGGAALVAAPADAEPAATSAPGALRRVARRMPEPVKRSLHKLLD